MWMFCFVLFVFCQELHNTFIPEVKLIGVLAMLTVSTRMMPFPIPFTTPPIMGGSQDLGSQVVQDSGSYI